MKYGLTICSILQKWIDQPTQPVSVGPLSSGIIDHDLYEDLNLAALAIDGDPKEMIEKCNWN